jgi:peptidoglycan L-alanyl-D-glutamate endopeptidase CwlK
MALIILTVTQTTFTMDNLTLLRIKTLHPKIRQQVLDAYTHINNRLLGRGVRLRFAYCTRTIEYQDYLYSLGRTELYNERGRRINIVTNARGGQSIHNYGLAWDIVILLDHNKDGFFEDARWDTRSDFDGDGRADWMEAVDYFKSIGATWGGDWKRFPDPPHFEINFGYTWQQLQKLPTFTEIVEGVTYKYPII